MCKKRKKKMHTYVHTPVINLFLYIYIYTVYMLKFVREYVIFYFYILKKIFYVHQVSYFSPYTTYKISHKFILITCLGFFFKQNIITHSGTSCYYTYSVLYFSFIGSLQHFLLLHHPNRLHLPNPGWLLYQ